MSGLRWSGRPSGFSFWQPPFAPRVVWFRRDRAVGAGRGLGLRPRQRSRRDCVKGERPSLVREPHRPIEPLFHQEVGSPNRVANLIELPVMHDGEILPQGLNSNKGTKCDIEICDTMVVLEP